MSSKWLLPIAAGMLVAACQSVDPRTGSPDPRFGEAVAWNKEVQTIDPDPVYTADAAKPGADGAVGAAAVDRYKKGSVRQTDRISTSSSGGGGGGGGGGGAN